MMRIVKDDPGDTSQSGQNDGGDTGGDGRTTTDLHIS